MAGRPTNITDIRPDYPTGVFGVYGSLARPYTTFGELRRSGDVDVVSIPLDLWFDVVGELERPDVLHSLLSKLSGRPLSALVCFTDREFPGALAVSTRLGLIDERLKRAVQLSLNKADLYDALGAAGVSVGRYKRVSSPNELEATLASFGMAPEKLIIKPSVSAGSAGVYRPHANETIEQAARNYLRRLPSHIARGDTLVMEYLGDGGVGLEEFCVDGVWSTGSVRHSWIHEKISQNQSGAFQDRLMVTPPKHHMLGDRKEEIEDIVSCTMRTMGCSASVFHIECRVSENNFFPIDIALRPGGGLIVESIRSISGFDLRIAHLLIHSGQSADLESLINEPSTGASAIGAFYTKVSNELDFDRVSKIGGVLGSRSEVVAFDVMCELTNSDLVGSDAGLSLCVTSDDVDGAATKIIAVASNLGFQ